MSPPRLDPLSGVNRTALWTLHCRAAFAARGELRDPEAIALAARLTDRMSGLGRPDPSFARRARLLDAWLQRFLDRHPGATVVALGEGLETQRSRVRGYGQWVSVDLPEVMAWRSALLPPGADEVHLAESALDGHWLSYVKQPSFVVAQGLFMYLEPSAVRSLLRRWSEAVPRSQAQLAFDVVPPWVTWISRVRMPLSPSFRIPQMPFGARRGDLERLARDVLPRTGGLELKRCPLPTGPMPVRGQTWAALLRA